MEKKKSRETSIIIEEGSDHDVSPERKKSDDSRKEKYRNWHDVKQNRYWTKFHDDTLEFLDLYSNLDVGTTFDTTFRSERVGFNSEPTENYAFIVDLDAFEYHKIGFHGFLGQVLQSAFFRFTILFLVAVNAVLIGLNTDQDVIKGRQGWFQAADQIIFSIFIFEIFLKWVYDFPLFWKVWWNVLDFLIVSLLILAIMIPFIAEMKELFAIIRVIRAFRILRSVSSLTALNVVTHTMYKSLGDMINILFVLILFMFVLAIAGVTIFDISELGTTYFSTAFDAWYVVFICVTQDGWVAVLDDFRADSDDPNDPRQTYFTFVAIYLIIGVGIGGFVFTNLIVAVVVANLELAVNELRIERLLAENPLEYHGEFSAQMIEVLSVYSILGNENQVLLGQRPMKIPDYHHISPRIIQAYMALLVALEQNMLEFVLLERDVKKIMGVILSIAKQLEGNPETAGKLDTKAGKELLLSSDFLRNVQIPDDDEKDRPRKVNFENAAKK